MQLPLSQAQMQGQQQPSQGVGGVQMQVPIQQVAPAQPKGQQQQLQGGFAPQQAFYPDPQLDQLNQANHEQEYRDHAQWSNQYVDQQYSEPEPSVASMLLHSMMTICDPHDSEKPRVYKPRNPLNTPNVFPTTPGSFFDDANLFERVETDTLFFVFYFQQGSYQQYLAAKELKRRAWRFHKQYLLWFQRHEEPNEITQEYERGTYIFFDYESGWCPRKKIDFKFEYRFLEDKDLV